MTRNILPSLLIALSIFCTNAQQAQTVPAGSIPAQTATAVTTDNASFHSVSHKGISFEVPDGSTELLGKGLTVKYPDGTFGVSVSVESRRGSDQKRCLQLCRKLASQMHIKDAQVTKVKINGKNGAVASGFLESQRVSIAILPSGSKEITCIVMNDPTRAPWADRVLRTLR